MKRVCFSVSRNPMFDFWGPLSCVIWREVTGFSPFVILVGLEEEWRDPKRGRVILKAYQEIGQVAYMINKEFQGPEILLSKLARWYACGLQEIQRATYLLTADIDIWPLDHAWFNQGNKPEHKMDFFYANAHHGKQFATCYIGGRAGEWREMLGLPGIPEDLPEDQIAKLLTDLKDRPFEHWRSDEAFMKDRLVKYVEQNRANLNLIDRKGHPPEDRIDRSTWPDPLIMKQIGTTWEKILDGAVDAHLPRASDDIVHVWTKVRPIFAAKCPAMLDWADGYIYQLEKLG